MSPSANNDAQTQWLAQVAAMRAAIADLNLPSKPLNGDWSTDDDFEDDEDIGWMPASGDGQDVWDFISDSEIEKLGLDSSSSLDGADGLGDEPAFDRQWFATRCITVANHRDGLPADTLQEQVMDALRSTQQEDELQSLLTDLVGFDDLDFVIDLISHRAEILAAEEQAKISDNGLIPTGRLLSKAEREENLRRQDFRHKKAALAPRAFKEPEYPHVYRSFTAGNSLSHAGKKYALPLGSERLQLEKYEEYFVPAGKAGTLWPGQKLVKIQDMDGLCRNTFKGYKTLNRMQSLVYPVAYKQRENMLICAPTGAVSALLWVNAV